MAVREWRGFLHSFFMQIHAEIMYKIK